MPLFLYSHTMILLDQIIIITFVFLLFLHKMCYRFEPFDRLIFTYIIRTSTHYRIFFCHMGSFFLCWVCNHFQACARVNITCYFISISKIVWYLFCTFSSMAIPYQEDFMVFLFSIPPANVYYPPPHMFSLILDHWLSQLAPVGFLTPCNGFKFLLAFYRDLCLPVLFFCIGLGLLQFIYFLWFSLHLFLYIGLSSEVLLFYNRHVHLHRLLFVTVQWLI